MAVLVENAVVLPQLMEEQKYKLTMTDNDSGHWSECTLPYKDLNDQEETTSSTCSRETPTSITAGSSPAVSERNQRITLDVFEEDHVIPLPPTPPPILASARVTSITHSHSDGISIAPTIDENQLCIICYDPNETTTQEVWDDFYWDMQVQYESTHKTLPCCGRLVCPSCLEAIKLTNINEGRVQVLCPHPECGKPFSKEYILQDLDANTKEKYHRFIVDITNDGRRKTCPNCGMITEHEMPKLRRTKKRDIMIKCETCDLEWCFKCQAPWHEGVSCRTYQKGDRNFQKWTKSRNNNVANCQKCPTCRVFIQRSAGCNHMTCNRCYTEFCYNCGDRFLILDHDSTLNAWGCSRNLYPNRPFLRRTVRGGYLGAKLSYLLAYPPLFVGVCVVVVIGGAIILPIYGGFKLYNLIKYKQELNANKRR